MNVKLFLVAFFIAISAYSQGNQYLISGKVTDQSGQPLFGATVTINNNSKATITNENGIYRLKNIAKGKHTVKTSYMGFKSAYKEINLLENNRNKEITLNFTLAEKLETLQQVNIKGKTAKRKIEEKGFAVNVIKTKEASIRNIQTNELLNTTVGVKIRQNGGLGSNIEYSLNGLTGSAVRIFIDGIPISVYGSSFNLNSIPPSMIKNIEVYKGVVPGHLSDDALGGAINIVLHKGTKTNFNASVSYGSFNTLQTNINGLYRFDKSGFTVKASAFNNYSDNNYKVWGGQVKHIEVNGIQTPITARRFNDAYRSTGGMAQIGYTNVKWADQFLIGVTGSDDYKEIQHGAFMTILPYKGRYLESDAILGSLTYQKKNLFTKGFDININGLIGKRNRFVSDTVSQAYTWRGVKMQREQFNEDGTVSIVDHKYTWGSQQEGGPTLLQIDRNVASIRSGMSYAFNNNHKVLVNHVYSGIKRKDSDALKSVLENTFEGTRDLDKNIYSLTYELTAFKDKLKTSLFGKYYQQKTTSVDPAIETDSNGNSIIVNETISSNKKHNGHGLAISYEITPNITVLTSAEKAIRLPSETEVFGDNGDNVIANSSIKPEQSNNYNLGFKFGAFNIKKHNFSVSTNFFTRNLKDRIGLPIETSLNVNDETILYVNQGSGSSKGVEAQLDYSYNKNFGLNFNISHFSLKVLSEGVEIDVPNTPFFTMNSNLRYSFKDVFQKNTHLNLFYSLYFTGEFSYLNIPSGVGGAGFFKVPQQLAQDFGLSYTFPSKKIIMSFDIKNIFDKPLYDNLRVQKPGRAFYLKINYSINKF